MLGVIGVILRVVGVLPGVIVGAEHLFGAGKGSDKKNMVLQFISTLLGATATVAPNTGIDFNKVNDATSKIIDGMVDLFNLTGVFAKQ